MIQTVQLHGRHAYHGKFPPTPIGHLMVRLPDAARKSVSMAFRRRSALEGRPPAWLAAASDVRLIGVTGDEGPTLRFDAPRLGDVAAELYEQGQLFPTRPSPDDTALDVLCDVIADVHRGNEESDRYDEQLLLSLIRFRSILAGEYDRLSVAGVRYPSEDPAVLDDTTVLNAQALHDKTPMPERVRISGVLDAVRISTQTFGLRLDDGQEIRALMAGDEFDRVLALMAAKQRVLVRGEAVFRPSGQLLLVEAEDIGRADDAGEIWSRMPTSRAGARRLPPLVRPQGRRSGLRAIAGKWPGEETDEEVEAALRGMRA